MGENIFELPLSGFWNIWVMGLIALNLALVIWLVWWSKKIPAGEAQIDGESTGHVYDGIEELDNPLPRWWLYMLYSTMIFGVLYFIIYPGFGNFPGLAKWSQQKQWQEEVDAADKKYAPIFKKYSAMSITTAAKNEEANKIGRRLFVNHCSLCHGTDAGGAKNFPNLVDNDWLYGGKPSQIKTSILNGRYGVMPPYGGMPLKDNELKDVTSYVLSLSGRKHNAKSATRGKAKFAVCGACHGQSGKGNIALGAPNLADDIWLHGGSEADISKNIKDGFDGQKNRMPSFKHLGDDKVNLLAAYVYSLSPK